MGMQVQQLDILHVFIDVVFSLTGRYESTVCYLLFINTKADQQITHVIAPPCGQITKL